MKEHLYLYKSGRVIIWRYDFSNEYTREMIFRLGVPAGTGRGFVRERVFCLGMREVA